MAKADTKKKPASSATRAESVRAFQAGRTPEERAESARKAQAARTPEQRAAIAAKAADTRKKNAAEKKRRQEAAAKGVATKRERYPERFKEPIPQEPRGKPEKKRGKKGAAAAPKAKDPRRVAAGLKGAATRKRNEAARLEAARQMRDGIEGRKRETGADWRSELEYITGPGIGTLGEWVKELFAAVVEDSVRFYRPATDPKKLPPGLLEIPWRVQGSVEGAAKGAGTFDVVVTGTAHERATTLIAQIVAAAEKGGVIGKDDSPIRRGKMNGGGGARAAKPLDAAAQRAKEEAVAKYSEAGDKERQPMRISTMTAPEYSAVWIGRVPEEPEDQDEDEDEEDFGDDDGDVPF